MFPHSAGEAHATEYEKHMRHLFATTALCLAATATHAENWVIKSCPHDVATTADRLEAIIVESCASVVARVDHQVAAQGAGLAMAPATVLIFGSPALGTPLMQADPRAALEMPQTTDNARARAADHVLLTIMMCRPARKSTCQAFWRTSVE